MAKCPNCNTSFKEPEGEEGDHPCPKCGLERDYEKDKKVNDD